MNKEKIIVEGSCKDISVKPITLIFNKDHCKVQYPERFMIDCTASVQYFEEINKIDKYTASLFKLTVPDYNKEVSKDTIKYEGTGYRHLIGLYSLTLKLISENKKFGWSYPESFLHPSIQLNVADVGMIISNHNLFEKFIKCVNSGKFDNYLKKDGGNLREYFFNVVCNQYLKCF